MARRLLVAAAACLGVLAFTPAAALADPPLDPPTRLQAQHVADVSADLSWVMSGLVQYGVVQRQVDGVWREYARVQYSGFLTLTDLTPGTTYTFRVYSIPYPGLGYDTSAPTAPVSFTTLPGPDTVPPATPPTPSVSNVTTTVGTVSWGEAIDNVEVTGYHLQQLTDAGWTTVRTVSPTARFQSFSGLTAATSYTFGVLAFDAKGNVSERSAPVILTTLPSTAQPLCQTQIISYSPTFQASVIVTNTTPAIVDGWTIQFTLPATATISNSFGGGMFMRDGEAVTVKPLSWSSKIGLGGRLNVGFTGTAVPFTLPTNFTLDGLPCTAL